MSISTSIYGSSLTSLALQKTYLGTDEHVDKIPVHDPETDIGAELIDTIIAGEAEIAQRTRKGNLCAFQFYIADATQNASGAIIAGAESAQTSVIMPFGGSVVAIAARCQNARTAGTAAIRWQIAGVDQDLTATLNATNTQSVRAYQLPGVEEFAALDLVGINIARDASWAAGTTPSIWVVLLVSFGEEEDGI